MKNNYLDYSMSVIVARALPESKDGLKPSQRRVLVAMNDLNLTPTAHYRKSAKIAGDTSGNYHPHGESIVYPTMVKLAQDFSTRYPLVDGQGNFGSVDGDPPAAMRYTEARMSKITGMMLQDLDKGTVTFIPNYDGTKLEPTVLPTVFPNLLCNGSDGIAVGMATKIPPHNLTEVVAALREMIKQGSTWEGKAIYNELRLNREKQESIPKTLNSKPASYIENYVLEHELNYEEKVAEIEAQLNETPSNGDQQVTLYPKFESEITPDQLIEIIPGPDFPLGGTIYDQKEILSAYSTGRGRVLMRAAAKIEDGKKGKMEIIITEIPYQVNKAMLITKIADLVKEKKITGISDIRDETTTEGMRIVIILKKDAQPKTVLNKLYKYTQMQMAFNANMISLVEQEPQTLSLKRMLELFLDFRLTVTIRRYEFDLAQARYRGHILEGLLKALDILDEIISTIRESKEQEEAKTNLIEKFEFTDVQAQAILDMQLKKLAALEREKLQDEFKTLSEKIKEYNKILSSEDEVLKVIDSDLKELVEKYGDDRRTKVVKGKAGEFSEEDLVANEESFVTISHEGYIKRLRPDTYRTQKRGGKGVAGASVKEGDYIKHAFSCMAHDDLLLFTNKGKVFQTKVHEVPEFSRTAKGLPLVNLVALDQGELVTSVLTKGKGGVMGEDEIQEDQDEKKVVTPREFKYLFMATKKGVVKKTEISDFDKIRTNGLISINLDGDDELEWVKATTGDEHIILVTREGRSIRFHEEDVRPTGRATRGVTGIRFKSGEDEIVSMNAVRDDENQLFTLSEYGYGKMTKLSDYPLQGRGGSGVFTFRVTNKTGRVAVARVMDHPNREIVIISESGVVIRSSIESIPTLGRQTSGVKVMSMKGDDMVAAMAIL
ncbi:MAG: DNA gyrase subunit A [Candidatus Dojkabacteria bacterium]|nr:MAG: DNA gyrase subunit A [Candidatus Dojkabacteria bacterium]